MFLEIMGVLYTGDAQDHVFGYIRCQHHYYVLFPFFCGALNGSCVEFVCQNFGTPHHLFYAIEITEAIWLLCLENRIPYPRWIDDGVML